VDEVYPRPRMIVGRKSEIPYKGHTMPDIVSLGHMNVACLPTPIDPDIGPNLPIEERSLHELPLKSVVLSHAHTIDRCVRCALVLEAVYNERPLFFG
jgi:hypothetical protein